MSLFVFRIVKRPCRLPPSPLRLSPSILIERPEHARAVDVLVDRAFGPGRFAKSSERLREGAITSWTTARSWPCTKAG